MNTNVMLALLAQLDVISDARAEALAKRINEAIAPARYAEAKKLVSEILAEVK